MTKDLRERAETYAQERCEKIQVRRDSGLSPYPIKPAIISDYIEGALSERKLVIQEIREKFDKALYALNDFECAISKDDFERLFTELEAKTDE